MNKGLIIFLVLAGTAAGYWMAQENRRLFEFVYRSDSPMPVAGDVSRLEEGLEKWQVIQIMGAPDSRSVLADGKELKKEEWRYGGRHLIFVNGILVSWDK